MHLKLFLTWKTSLFRDPESLSMLTQLMTTSTTVKTVTEHPIRIFCPRTNLSSSVDIRHGDSGREELAAAVPISASEDRSAPMSAADILGL